MKISSLFNSISEGKRKFTALVHKKFKSRDDDWFSITLQHPCFTGNIRFKNRVHSATRRDNERGNILYNSLKALSTWICH